MQTWSCAHLRSKGIDDLTCEGLCELEDEEDGELSPGNGRVLALVRIPEQRGLLIGLRASYRHGEGERKERSFDAVNPDCCVVGFGTYFYIDRYVSWDAHILAITED